MGSHHLCRRNDVSHIPVRNNLSHEVFPLSLSTADCFPTNDRRSHLNGASSSLSMAQHRTRRRALKRLTRRGRGASVFQLLATTANCCDVGYVTIDELPEDVLLEIFSFYVDEATRTEDWHTLVHVCRRWRDVVISSPRRLDLRLLCTTRRPVRARLDVWPAFPIVIVDSVD